MTLGQLIDYLLGRPVRPSQLDRIEDSLQRLEDSMSTQEQDLDAVLAAIKQGQAENVAAFDETEAGVTKLIALVTTPGVDLSDENAEFAEIRDSLLANVARVKATNDAINAALPPVTPTP